MSRSRDLQRFYKVRVEKVVLKHAFGHSVYVVERTQRDAHYWSAEPKILQSASAVPLWFISLPGTYYTDRRIENNTFMGGREDLEKGMPLPQAVPSRQQKWTRFFAAGAAIVAIWILINLSNRLHHPRAQETIARVGKVTTSYGEIQHTNGSYYEAMQTQQDHSKLHGYPTFIVDEQILGGMWTKPAALLDKILEQLQLPEEQRLEWLFWFDADTIILNQNTPLEMFLPPPHMEDVHLLYTTDWNGLNSGVFFIKVDTWSVLYLSSVLAYTVYRPDENLWFDEQSALEKVMHFDQFSPGAVECPAQWFNAYPHNKDLGHVENWAAAGSLLVHFAGEEQREEKMAEWLRQLQHDPYQHSTHWNAYRAEVDAFWQDYIATLQ